MYSRSYYPDQPDRINLPQNYDGTAFSEKRELQEEEVAESVSVASEGTTVNVNKSDEPASLLTSLPFLSGIFGQKGALGGLGFKMPTIGTEEVLIIAAAAFLFFSKSGDKECAIILLLLLFIS